MNIASQILQHAKQRQLDKYYQAGLGVIQLSQGFLQSCKETMGSEYQRQGTDEAIEGLEELRELDKARLLILLLLNSQPSSQFYEEFVRLEQGMGLRSEKYKGAIAYVKEKVRFGAQTAKSDAKEGQYRSMFMGLASRVRTHSKGLLQNVSTFLPLKEKKYAVVSLMENMFDDLRGQDYMDLFKIYDHRTQQILVSTPSPIPSNPTPSSSPTSRTSSASSSRAPASTSTPRSPTSPSSPTATSSTAPARSSTPKTSSTSSPPSPSLEFIISIFTQYHTHYSNCRLSCFRYSLFSTFSPFSFTVKWMSCKKSLFSSSCPENFLGF